MTAADRATLTDRQAEIYGFLREHILGRGYPPTIRGIGDRFGIRSPNGIMCHLKALERKRFIERDPGAACGIRLVDPDGLAPLFDRCRRLPPDRYGQAAAALDSILAETEGQP